MTMTAPAADVLAALTFDPTPRACEYDSACNAAPTHWVTGSCGCMEAYCDGHTRAAGTADYAASIGAYELECTTCHAAPVRVVRMERIR